MRKVFWTLLMATVMDLLKALAAKEEPEWHFYVLLVATIVVGILSFLEE